MTYFTIYTFAAIPFFLVYFVRHTTHVRKFNVDAGMLFGMVIVAVLPFLRELVVLNMLIDGFDMDKVIFKAKK